MSRLVSGCIAALFFIFFIYFYRRPDLFVMRETLCKLHFVHKIDAFMFQLQAYFITQVTTHMIYLHFFAIVTAMTEAFLWLHL